MALSTFDEYYKIVIIIIIIIIIIISVGASNRLASPMHCDCVLER